MDSSNNIFQILITIGSLATPLFVLALGALGWRIRSRIERRYDLENKFIERRYDLENKLRDDRIETYNDILEQFIFLFTSDKAWRSDPKNAKKDRNQIAMRKLLSTEYRRKAFKMSLVGSDSVVLAYNDLMQFFYQRDDKKEPESDDVVNMISLVGKFLLEIRKSMGNDATKIDHWQMLEWFITDARKYREKEANASWSSLNTPIPTIPNP